jgi:tetratricopeptide (TPR) repeat protein
MKTPLALLLIAMLCGVAHANPSPARAPINDAALPYFQRGSAHYEAGEYAKAIEAFEKGRRLDPHPDFLYAEAQAYRRSGDCARAISLYQAFLATHPPKEEAERARANVERCPLDLQPQAQAPEAPPHVPPTPVTTPPQAESPWYADVTGGALAAAGTIGVAVGATYLVMGDHNFRDANHAGTLSDGKLADIEKLASTGSRDRRIGEWCIAGGSALLVGAIVRYALHRRSGGTTGSALRVTPAAGGAAVAWGGSF